MDDQTENILAREEAYPFGAWALHLEAALRAYKGRPRHCAMNAFRGLRRAWQIAPIDPEMALFRALTAEEEAATGLIFALQRRQYPGASKLNARRHVDKAGWRPFLQTVETVFAESGFPAVSYQIDLDVSPPRLEVCIPATALGLGEGFHASPDEPLNGVLSQGTREDGIATVMDFREQLQKRAEAGGAADMLSYIEQEANLRNKLLYAGDDGWPVVTAPDDFLIRRRKPVVLLLALTLAILQTPKHQLLAVQGLEAYLHALGRLPPQPFDFAEALGTPKDLTLLVERVAGGEPTVSLHRGLSSHLNLPPTVNEAD